MKIRHFALLLILLLLPSCAGPSDGPADDWLAAANEVRIDGDTVTFFDDSPSGEPITLKIGPKRTVSLYASFTTLWYEAGGSVISAVGGDAAEALYAEAIGRNILDDDGVSIAAPSPSAKKWDIERILSLSPDLILCSSAMSGYATISGPAKAAGIPVICVDYDDYSDYLKWFKVFCHLNGRPELWESVALASLRDVTALKESVPDTDPPKVLCLFGGTEDLQANTVHTAIGGMLNDLGAVNIAVGPGERIPVNLESVAAADPDVILIQGHIGTDAVRELVDRTLGDHPVWQSLRAVKQGRVYVLDKSLFHNKPNRRFADAYRILFDILYAQ